MDDRTLIARLSHTIDLQLDDIKAAALLAASDSPHILDELKEADRLLGIAQARELMDEYQAKLAFRVTVKKIVLRLQRALDETVEEI